VGDMNIGVANQGSSRPKTRALDGGEVRGGSPHSLHPQPWQEGTSKFATLEMNPKRAQRRPKEMVSNSSQGWGCQGAEEGPPPAIPHLLSYYLKCPIRFGLWTLSGPCPDQLASWRWS
jgi:hypothetical protein